MTERGAVAIVRSHARAKDGADSDHPPSSEKGVARPTNRELTKIFGKALASLENAIKAKIERQLCGVSDTDADRAELLRVLNDFAVALRGVERFAPGVATSANFDEFVDVAFTRATQRAKRKAKTA